MNGDWPPTDSRRASKLREVLEKSAPMLAPEWAGLQHEGDFGRALVEIAARLAEHSTRRLDQSAGRDKLAFLDALDVATPPPQPATAPIVFTLAEKRETPVFAPARVQLSAEKDDEEISFETREAIALTPARLAALVAADPATDRIESAPSLVTGSVDAVPPATRYLLLSAVEAGASALQLVQAVGIQPDDLLRLGEAVYRVEKIDGAIVQLRDALAGSAPAGAKVEKLIALDAFNLRNLQEHDAYIGHKELLKLDGPAEIILAFEPPGLAQRLAGLDLEFHIWGTIKVPESGPAWQTLRATGAKSGGLILRKDWAGSVDEVEAPGGTKSRWIRLRLRTPIAGACGPDTRAASVKLKVQSVEPAPPEQGRQPEGSRTIVNAFYNSLPLPTSTSFFPFGPEPQRFDTFALAAPEALSKKGATITLDVTVGDASLMTMALAAGGPDRVYGVGRNGRLQSIRFQDGKGRWRQLGLPSAPADSGGAAEGAARLGTGPLHALAIPAASFDLIFVADRTRLIRAATVRTAGDSGSVASWQELPPPSDAEAFNAFCLVPSADPEFRPHRLVAADANHCYGRPVERSGVIGGLWHSLASGAGAPNFKPPIAIVAAGYLKPPPANLAAPAGEAPPHLAETFGFEGIALDIERAARAAGAAAAPSVIALVDSDGAIYRGDIAPGFDAIAWLRLPSAAADPGVQPAAFLDGANKLVVLAARKTGDELLVLHEVDGELPLPTGGPENVIGRPASIAILPEMKDPGSPLPLVAAAGSKGFFIWAFGEAVDAQRFPPEVDPEGPHQLLIRPAGSTAGARPALLLNAASEILLHGEIGLNQKSVNVTRHDWIGRKPLSHPTHLVLDRATAQRKPLSDPWLSFAFSDVHALPAGTLAAGTNVDLVEAVGGSLTGNKAGANKIKLSASDTRTAKDDLLLIGGVMRQVQEITPGSTSSARDTATLDGAVAGANDVTVGYTVFKHVETAAITDSNLGQLLDLGGADVPDWAYQLNFPSPAAPSAQLLQLPLAQPQGASWVFVNELWTTPPAQGSQATLVGGVEIGPWMQIRLPREADNPELSWDYFDGDGWRRIEHLVDGTANLAKSGLIGFPVPDDLTSVELGGNEDYWIRARLTGGDFGRATYLVSNEPVPLTTPPTSRQSVTVDRSRLNPPEILSIEARYVLDDEVPPQCVVTFNNLAALDQTQAAAAEGARFNLFEGVAQHVGDAGGGTRALYLGFAKSPGVPVLNLYADAVDRDEAPRELLAEALTPDGWKKISTEDKTAALTRPGMLCLFLNPPPEQLPLFGRDGWWLRLRPKRDAARWAPMLRGLFVNAVIAEHAKSVSQEILGSSLGEPDQRYQLAQKPVLPATLELRVLESLGEEERKKVEKSSGKDAITDDDPNLPGEWVRWRQVETFVDQDGDARVFRLDPTSGEVRFGNGRCGKIPPAGADSIRAFSYQAGGGSAGNVAARAIANLGSAIESVELAMNPVDAAGGADAPRADRLATTAPALLRHAGRALAPVDIEALAVESAPDVVRARCLARKGCGIALAVAIRGTGARCPVPTRARREGIARNIVAAGWGALAADSVTVHSPRYLHVAVAAVVAATSADAVAGVDQKVRKRLTDFLHPVEGGPDGLGWPFGRRVWPSDLQRAIADIDGLDRVIALDLATKNPNESLDAMPPEGLVCVEEADITLVVQPPEDGR